MAAVMFLPVVVFGALASYVSGLGAAAWWAGQAAGGPPAALAHVAGGALHLAWLHCAALRRAPLVGCAAFLVSLIPCRQGLASLLGGSSSWTGPMLLEGLPLMTALALCKPPSLAARLARWRRSRAEIALQLRMGDGLLPWARECGRRLIYGRADLPATAGSRLRPGRWTCLSNPRLQVSIPRTELQQRVRGVREQCKYLPRHDLRASVVALCLILWGRIEDEWWRSRKTVV